MPQFGYAVAGAVLVAAAYSADAKLGGALLLLVILAMLLNASAKGFFSSSSIGGS